MSFLVLYLLLNNPNKLIGSLLWRELASEALRGASRLPSVNTDITQLCNVESKRNTAGSTLIPTRGLLKPSRPFESHKWRTGHYLSLSYPDFRCLREFNSKPVVAALLLINSRSLIPNPLSSTKRP